MYFVLQTPSLQHLALVKIVAELWSLRDILNQIGRSFNCRPAVLFREQVSKEWKAIEDQVRNKVWALPLPKLCKHQLLHLVQPLGMELITWCRYHNLHNNYYCRFQFIDICFPQQLRWTMHGNVDYAKTYELMVKDERLSVERRYEKACINCLEDETRDLFESMGEERRLSGEGLEKTEQRGLITACARILLGSTCSADADPLNGEFLTDAFIMALLGGNRATCDYFFTKLRPEEKERVLGDYPMRFFRRGAHNIHSPTANWMYYLALQNDEQRERMFRECIRGLLILLLRWPLQVLFTEAVDHGWRYMEQRDSADVLSAIAAKIENGFHDYDYSQLFWQCWALSSADAQQHFLSVHGLKSLFAIKEDKFTRLILNQAPAHQLEKLLHVCCHVLGPWWVDERPIITEAALMECKQTTALNSSNERDNVEKRLRSEYVGRLVDIEIEKRMRIYVGCICHDDI